MINEVRGGGHVCVCVAWRRVASRRARAFFGVTATVREPVMFTLNIGGLSIHIHTHKTSEPTDAHTPTAVTAIIEHEFVARPILVFFVWGAFLLTRE